MCFGIQLRDCSKLAINRKKKHKNKKLNFFWCCFVVLINCSHRSKIHVSIITGYGVATIFIYNRLTRKPEIGNTPIWVLPNIWRLGRLRDTKLGKNVSDKMLLNAAKRLGYSFYHFWATKGKPTGWGRGGYPRHPRLGLNKFNLVYISGSFASG